MSFVAELWQFMRLRNELWQFMRLRKKYWLLPIVLMMALLGGLVVLTRGGAVHLHRILSEGAAMRILGLSAFYTTARRR